MKKVGLDFLFVAGLIAILLSLMWVIASPAAFHGSYSIGLAVVVVFVALLISDSLLIKDSAHIKTYGRWVCSFAGFAVVLVLFLLAPRRPEWVEILACAGFVSIVSWFSREWLEWIT